MAPSEEGIVVRDGSVVEGVDPLGSVQRHHLLDTWVDGFTVESFLEAVSAWADDGKRVVVANHNVNSLVHLHRDTVFARFYDTVDANYIDGAAVVVLARMLGSSVPMRHRIAVLDWIWPLFAEAEAAGWSVVHVGGAPAALETATNKILRRHPGVRLTAISGYFDMDDPAANQTVLDQVHQARPTILLVGMGMPRQETWLEANLERLPECVIITVGGILSFLGDERPTAPRWLGSIGLEWLFRLLTEPTRLWRRYLVEPFTLVPVIAADLRKRRL